ncbi:Adenylate kinase 2 [Nymphaea thermarum]|nr:Adenylate kinase 2 [Nymphaea thermarum]
MANVSNFSLTSKPSTQFPSRSSPSGKSLALHSQNPDSSRISFNLSENFSRASLNSQSVGVSRAAPAPIVASKKNEPLKVMISGAPASGKGTQCELIVKKYGLVHIAAGDLLRAEVAADTEKGKEAKQYMEKGQLVPNDIVVMMVKDRLLQRDALENGWLLDGYPRSISQATALEDLKIRPDLFLLLDVPEEILVERVVGRRLDPVTGKIYHLKYSPPETQEIAERLTQRFDDTEEKVDGNGPIDRVFSEIDAALTRLVEQNRMAESANIASGMAS